MRVSGLDVVALPEKVLAASTSGSTKHGKDQRGSCTTAASVVRQ